jgi:hypothetical protein
MTMRLPGRRPLLSVGASRRGDGIYPSRWYDYEVSRPSTVAVDGCISYADGMTTRFPSHRPLLSVGASRRGMVCNASRVEGRNRSPLYPLSVSDEHLSNPFQQCWLVIESSAGCFRPRSSPGCYTVIHSRFLFLPEQV